jgi:hypothetical protein
MKWAWWAENFTRDRALSRRDGALSRRDGALSRRDGALSRRDRALSRRDGALKCLVALASNYFGSILELETSNSDYRLRFGP